MTPTMTTATALIYSIEHGCDRSRDVTLTGAEVEAALRAAEKALDAWQVDGDTWRYVAPETSETYEISTSDMIDAGASIMAGVSDWYSLWCSACGEVVE